MTRQPTAGRARARTARKSARPQPTRARRRSDADTPAPAPLTAIVLAALDDLKAQNVIALDVRNLTDVTDTVVIASGTSDRHVKSLAGRVLERVQEAGFRALGVEGRRDGEWVLVDLRDLVLHLMLPRVREFYSLEKLWGAPADERAARA
jgi:ribosome-associated protein